MYCIYNETTKKYWNFEKGIFSSIEKGCFIPNYIQINGFLDNLSKQYSRYTFSIHCVVTKKTDSYVECEV